MRALYGHQKGTKKKNQRWVVSRSVTGGALTSFDRDIRRIARRYSIDPLLIKAIIHTESNFDHKAVSRSGAQGLMQLMPATARELRVANPFNPRQNIDGGTRYFRQILNDFNGNLVLSLTVSEHAPTPSPTVFRIWRWFLLSLL